LASIEASAFLYCTNLPSITLPASVIMIGPDVFLRCTRLVSITVDGLNPAFSSQEGVLFSHDKTCLIAYPAGRSGPYSVPEGVTAISASAFDSSGITTLTLPEGITDIGAGAFASCASLTSLALPGRLSTIAPRLFINCTSLTNITVPRNLTSIGARAFAYCDNLLAITLPNTLKSIGSQSFYHCSRLHSLYFEGAAPLAGDDVFFGNNLSRMYYLPGTAGWTSTFGGRPTALWHLPSPVILSFGSQFGVRRFLGRLGNFGFRISWATNVPVAVEACTNLAAPVWFPLTTNTLTSGWTYFSDPKWTNHPSRIYRVRSQ
jgi:hypothetical protein